MFRKLLHRIFVKGPTKSFIWWLFTQSRPILVWLRHLRRALSFGQKLPLWSTRSTRRQRAPSVISCLWCFRATPMRSCTSSVAVRLPQVAAAHYRTSLSNAADKSTWTVVLRHTHFRKLRLLRYPGERYPKVSSWRHEYFVDEVALKTS